ncbi:MAG: hypothetical protein M1812_001567 [Candelaria pacifica]|nr:MAG: hypothetical protein M1812_001567 [Candelaria pacifica]
MAHLQPPPSPLVLQQIQALTARIDGLETRLKASEANSTARLANSRIQAPSYHLNPLHDVHTNKPIKHFPGREQDIRLMSGALGSPDEAYILADVKIADEVVEVLKALDEDVGGTPADRKQKLRICVGLQKI